MKKAVIVNIYNFIRMSHAEPSCFIADDFETIRNEIVTVKQYGFPGTYALKYDALMEPRYQKLLKSCLDDSDEISAWWEITEPLCRRAGVAFRGGADSELYDDRVDSAYSIGYTPQERKALVDAYMVDFYSVFGKYPQSIGSWVLDCVTLAYASERYGVAAGAICRDQMGVDGFTLWGGYPNGIYYPSRNNEFIPAQTAENQLEIPVFRLLGPDPIYNFEADVREGLQGVYTLEPSWLTGRDPRWISWLFGCLTEEDTLGPGYAQVGQENNFLWENIRPGLAPQLDVLKALSDRGKIRVQTMGDSARWFRKRYSLTPPMTFQASHDWDGERNLSAQWYACAAYRLGFLGEGGHLRIRDCFLFDEAYPSRYLNGAMTSKKSTFDALPLLFPQCWQGKERPFIRLRDENGREPAGTVRYGTADDLTAWAELAEDNLVLARFTMTPEGVTLQGPYRLVFDTLPVFASLEEDRICMVHEGFRYTIRVTRGRILRAGREGVEIAPAADEIRLTFGKPVGETNIFAGPADTWEIPVIRPKMEIPPFAPEFEPGDWVFPWGGPGQVALTCRESGQIRYTLDGSDPTPNSPLYESPLILKGDTVLSARVFLPDGRQSDVSRAEYRFGLREMTLESSTVLDCRPVFRGGGLGDLLNGRRGSLDYLDGCWRGTLQDIDITCRLERPWRIQSISMGFLSHHRSGIVYPRAVELYAGEDAGHLTLLARMEIPNRPGAREIEKWDVEFPVHRRLGAFRIVARRYEKMPQWCAYRGSPDVFTMADSLIVVPEA